MHLSQDLLSTIEALHPSRGGEPADTWYHATEKYSWLPRVAQSSKLRHAAIDCRGEVGIRLLKSAEIITIAPLIEHLTLGTHKDTHLPGVFVSALIQLKSFSVEGPVTTKALDLLRNLPCPHNLQTVSIPARPSAWEYSARETHNTEFHSGRRFAWSDFPRFENLKILELNRLYPGNATRLADFVNSHRFLESLSIEVGELWLEPLNINSRGPSPLNKLLNSECEAAESGNELVELLPSIPESLTCLTVVDNYYLGYVFLNPAKRY